MKRLSLLLLALLLVGGMAQAQRSPEELYVGRAPAPEFPAGLDWINVENPLTMSGLLGKIVIFDFWTYGCINCLHIIPILEQVEQKYADEVVVIGVHSAKFQNEGQTENLRQIVQRYGVHHPVVNDRDFTIWRTYGVRAWPTVAIVEPQGNVVVRQSGEIPFEAFDQYLSGMIAYYDELDPTIINRTPLELALEGAGDPGTALLFPGKVLADADGARLFIADSSHNRIVIADLNTREVLDIIGTAARGFDDGAFESAAFDKPQGLALHGDSLLIADVNNHAIRAANLSARTVTTLVGNGEMGRGQLGVVASAELLVTPLRSPWDLEISSFHADAVHVAMAGTHQLFLLDLNSMALFPSVGNGREANLNGVSLANSELAQPSGLYDAGDGKLYFADSESSTIRLADFAQDLVTVASGTTANDLFDFGDIDGELGANRLQHALGVEGGPQGEIYIADTYNSRIKVIPAGATGTFTAFGLGGLGGYVDGDASVAEFDEPGGISYADGILYVADTNNHVIRTIDLQSGIVDTLDFANPEALVIDTAALTILAGNTADDLTLELETQRVAAGAGLVRLQLNFLTNYKINPLIDSELTLTTDLGVLQRAVVTSGATNVPVTFAEGSGQINADLNLYYCREGEEALCFIETFRWIVPVEAAADHSATEIALERVITAPEV